MPDVKFSNLYPYTDFHELNLDWIIKEVKFWSERVGKSIQKIELTGTVGLVDTYTISYSDDTTSTFDVTNGNGIASVAKTGTAGLVDTYTITFQDGNTTTFEVHNGTASIDATLSIAGRAADAKATGDALEDNIKLLAGVVEKQNLFDKDTATTGGYYSSYGSISINPASGYSEQYIPVSEGTYYYRVVHDSGSQLQVCTYNSSKTFIERLINTTASTGNIAITSGVAFIRVSCYASLAALQSLVISTAQATTALPYEYTLINGLIIREKMADGVLATVANYFEMPLNYSGMTIKNGYYDNNGAFISNPIYNSYIFPIGEDCQCYFNLVSAYYSICRFSGDPDNGGSFISPRYRYKENDEDTAPKENSKLSLLAGQYVALTYEIAQTPSGFYLNDPTIFRYLAQNIILSNAQITQIENAMGSNKSLAVYYGTSTNDNGLFLYFKTGYGKLRYDFEHYYNVSSVCDTWRVNSLYSVDDELNVRFQATTGGEWECAVRLDGRPDFSGGKAHGDEVTTSIFFIFDGVPYTVADLADAKQIYFDDLKILEISALYDPNDDVTEIAEHSKEYQFEKDGTLILNQHLDWVINDTLSNCYLAMLTPSKTYTDKIYYDTDFLPKSSISEYGSHPGIKKATQYSNDKGFLCSMEITKYPTGLPGGDSFNLRDNGGGDYNKMYFDVCSSGSITAGTRWTSQTIYRFNVGEPVA